MMKKTIICFAIVMAGLSSVFAGGTKPAKVMGTVNVPVVDLVDGPVMQDRDVCAAYQTAGQVSVSVFNTKGELKNALAIANASGIQIVGFKKYAVVVKAVVDGKVRFFSYKLGKKGVKVNGSTAPTSFDGKNVINCASDGKNTWVVTQDVAEDGTLGAKSLLQYTNKLEGTSKKAAVAKTIYAGTDVSNILLPNVQNKYKYDVQTVIDEVTLEPSSISVKIIK
jgi:hypothetical protein